MVRPNRGGGRTYPVGGCGIQVRSDTRYFRLKTVDSAQGWRKGWFYATVEQDAAAPFSTAAFTRTKAWDHQLSAEEMEEASPLLEVCMCYSLLAMKSLPLACSAICDFLILTLQFVM